VLSIAESPKGTIWFGTNMHRLFRLTENGMTRFRSNDGLPGVQFVDLQPAHEGGLWVVGGGLTKVVDPDRFTLLTIPNIPTQLVNAVFEDREGTLWVCSRDMGLIRARKVPYHTTSIAEGLPAEGVKTVSQDAQGNIWLAVLRKGPVRISPNGEVRTYTSRDGMTNGDPWSVLAARDGRVWVGGRGVLCVGQNDHWQQIPTLRGVLGLFEDSHGDIWVGTETDGVFRYHNGEVLPVDLGPGVTLTRPASFCETHDGTMYIGSLTAGLVKLQNGKSTVYTHQNGLPADDIRAIFEDSEHRIWIGLRSRGLALWDNGRWLNPNSLSEALADHVTAIAEDGLGQLWLGTTSGVMWASKAALAAAARDEAPMPAMQHAGTADIAHTATVWSGPQPIVWKANDGKLLFATRRGLLTINPGRWPRNPVAPPVHIEQITVDGKITRPPNSVLAPAGAREIAIEYTALSFVQPKLVRFKYRLEGYDLGWIDAGSRRTAYYTNLPPGNYTFHVQACNNDGVWNTEGDRIGLVQEPHFYQVWWFYACLVTAGAALALAIYRWRTDVLRRENEKLNRVVAERTRELELSSMAKTEFLETVSHEIRNPLNGLTGLLGQLKVLRLGASESELLDAIQACSRTLTRVFEDVLAHTRLEHGYLERHERSFRLKDLLDEVARSFAWQASQHGIRIDVSLAAEFVDGFIGDENKIKTIVENFVGNAIKYAPDSPIELQAEAHPSDTAGAIDLHIEVRDHGPGIAAEEQRLIFRKFVRGADAKRNRVPGTGLGLATCEMLARVMGGNVGVESELGKGAIFFLRLPLRRAEPTDAPLPAKTSGLVLIVEDEHYNQVVLRGIALELGYAAKVASNAEQADALLTNESFDVVFLDWELPGLKGGDIARRIRAQPLREQPIIIAMTAHDGADVRRQCEEAGMDEFLRKPYDVTQVRHRIADTLTRRVAATLTHGATQPATLLNSFEAVASNGSGPDWSAFDHYAAGSTEPKPDARASFVAALRKELDAVNTAAAANDIDQIARAAHRMYAVAALVRAPDLMDAAKSLERLPHNAPPTERAQLVKKIGSAADALEAQAMAR
jgi:signal transduction histidine kinase/CheY-like chemotaxis protein/HPt (histidine-containing phosphotransfer) domain-containing protein